MTQNRAASVLAKLANKSAASGKSLQVHLQLFCQEEFLRRLSLSKYADNFVLKGGLFIYTLTNFESRATVDVDFLLRQLPGTVEELQAIINEIVATESGNEFITLEAQGFETIAPHRKYKGVSFQMLGRIGRTRTPFHVDIGIGDIVIPQVEKRTIPLQLPEFSQPCISTYSLESTVAEKLDAILERLELTSRMKDFYDIWYLASTFDFDGEKLQQAIAATLQNRGTPHTVESLATIRAMEDSTDMQAKWTQFLKRLKLAEMPFEDALYMIDTFLRPVWEAMMVDGVCDARWSAELGEWKSTF